jgi:hypothetical protein
MIRISVGFFVNELLALSPRILINGLFMSRARFTHAKSAGLGRGSSRHSCWARTICSAPDPGAGATVRSTIAAKVAGIRFAGQA